MTNYVKDWIFCRKHLSHCKTFILSGGGGDGGDVDGSGNGSSGGSGGGDRDGGGSGGNGSNHAGSGTMYVLGQRGELRGWLGQ